MTPQFLTSPLGERYLHEVNRDAFVDRISAEAFERRFGSELDAENTLHVIVGTDSGLLAAWLSGRRLGAGSRALLVELDEYHALVSASIGERRDDAGPIVCAASGWEGALEALGPKLWLYGGRVLVAESIGCAAGYSVGYAALARRIRARLGELVLTASVRINQRLFVEVQLRNVADNVRPAASAGRIGEGCTAIVLGGGPSLDDHLAWVLAHRRELFVIAASRLAGKLRASGVEPDVVMAVDPQDMLFDISKEGLEWREATLVSAYHVCAPLLQQWAGPMLYTGRALPWESDALADEDNLVSVGSTVSHAGLWLAYHWGFSQILLSGVDLCYAPGGATHASGSVESLCATLPSHYDAQVTTYAGRRAGTAMPLKLGRDELEVMGATIAASGVRLYNLAVDAARVDSIPHRDPDDVELGVPRPELEGATGDASRTEAHLRAVLRELSAARGGLRDVRRRCTEAGHCLDGLHGARGRAPDYRFKRRLDAVDRRLERRSARWVKLVKRYGAFELVRNIAPKGFEAMSDAELERWGREYYRILDANAKRLGTLIERAIERVEHRRLEARPAGAAVRLIDYWREDDTLGRAVTALADTAPGLSGIERSAIEAARAEHAARLERTDTAYVRAHTAGKSNAANVLRTIALLSAEADREDLSRLAGGLASMGESWSLIAQWAAGQCAELDAVPELALEHYRELIERHARMREKGESVPPGAERLLEDVLIRIVNLQLADADGEAALAGLSILAGLSPAYVPRLAALLGLLGRHVEGADLLQGLIGSGTGGWQSAEQMADLYRDAGAKEAASLARELAATLRRDAADVASGGAPRRAA